MQENGTIAYQKGLASVRETNRRCSCKTVFPENVKDCKCSTLKSVSQMYGSLYKRQVYQPSGRKTLHCRFACYVMAMLWQSQNARMTGPPTADRQTKKLAWNRSSDRNRHTETFVWLKWALTIGFRDENLRKEEKALKQLVMTATLNFQRFQETCHDPSVFEWIYPIINRHPKRTCPIQADLPT